MRTFTFGYGTVSSLHLVIMITKTHLKHEHFLLVHFVGFDVIEQSLLCGAIPK